MRILDLEQPARDVELAPGRDLDRAAAEIDGGGAAGDANGEIGVADRRQVGNRLQRGGAALHEQYVLSQERRSVPRSQRLPQARLEFIGRQQSLHEFRAKWDAWTWQRRSEQE